MNLKILKIKSLTYFLFMLLLFSSKNHLIGTDKGFSADISFSESRLALNENLSVNVRLSFPDNFHPNIEEMKSELLAYNGFYPPPFHLVKTDIKNREKIGNILVQEIIFTLSPQIPGKHRITFQLIKFESDVKEEKPVFILTDIFDVEFTVSKTSFDTNDLISPPMNFSKNFPVTIDLSNKKQFQDSNILQEKIAIEQSLLTKNPPWLMLISAVVVIIAIAIIRS